jgi:hypothetical protein
LPVKLAHRCPKNWRDFAKLLVEAGAPIDGPDWESPPICDVIDPMAEHREWAIIECTQTILALGGTSMLVSVDRIEESLPCI